MTTILNKILAKKEEEVARLKMEFQKEIQKTDRKGCSLYNNMLHSDHMSIISEIKRASPSKGAINLAVNPPEQAKAYEAHGAAAISVLTDEPFFKGTFADLEAVREAVQLPLLCKDFIIDEIQIERAQQAGVDVILLIAAALDETKLAALYESAQIRNLEVLLEVHNEEEMERALALNAAIIGINNRDLNSFTVDLSICERLLKRYYREDVMFISESGIRDTEDVNRVAKAGAKGILVGETFMKSNDIAQSFEQLKICL